MNTERLHAIAIAVIDDINTTNLLVTLGNLVKSLQNQINQPQEPKFQNQVSQHFKDLSDTLVKSKINNFSPAWKELLKELGVYDLLGNTLFDRIQEIFERNQIIPATVLKELTELHKQLSNYKTSFEGVISSFQTLKIGSEKLEKGQCEVGVLIPRAAVSNKLKEFSTDLDKLDNLFGTFSELTTYERPGFKISSVSSTDFNVMLATAPVIAASIAFAVDRILTVYKRILEIKKLHGELKKQGLTDKELQPIKKKADLAIIEEVEKLAPELLEKYYKKEDTSRRNELSNALKKALIEIAKRIDKGYNVEIRVPIDVSDEISKDANVNTIISVLKNLEFIQLEGEPILSLPETANEKEDEKETHENYTKEK
jgi:hypothetical protein